MIRFLEKYLPIITLTMSLPLFFSYQLKNPPQFLTGLPFVAVWSWGVLAAIALPILVALEIIMCAWMLWHVPAKESKLWWHGTAVLAAVVAEVVFFGARRSLA